MTGALLMQEAKMMPMPMVLATRRDRQGELRSGRESRQIFGDTSGEGSDSHIQVARARMNPLSDRAETAPMVMVVVEIVAAAAAVLVLSSFWRERRFVGRME